MKRLLFLLIPFLLLSAAQAAPQSILYDVALCLTYPTLTAKQQAIFDLAYDAAWRGETNVPLPSGAAYQDTTIAMDALLRDCPELCALDATYTVTYPSLHPDRAEAVTLRYAMHPSAQQTLLERARQLLPHAPADEWQRALWFHDSLCLLVTYAEDAWHPYSAYGALCENRAVCEGYADAMALLCRLSGIPCSVVTGTAWRQGTQSTHAWNLLKVRGSYTLCDVTWDDQQSAAHYYFGLNDAQLAADHRIDDSCRALPAATRDDLNWYAVNDLLVPTEPGPRDAFLVRGFQSMLKNNTPFAMRFTSEADYRAAAADPVALIDRYNALCAPSDQFYGTFHYITVDAQLCMTIER